MKYKQTLHERFILLIKLLYSSSFSLNNHGPCSYADSPDARDLSIHDCFRFIYVYAFGFGKRFAGIAAALFLLVQVLGSHALGMVVPCTHDIQINTLPIYLHDMNMHVCQKLTFQLIYSTGMENSSRTTTPILMYCVVLWMNIVRVLLHQLVCVRINIYCSNSSAARVLVRPAGPHMCLHSPSST